MISNQMDSARPDKDTYRTDLDILPKCGNKWVHDRSIVSSFKNAKAVLGLMIFRFGFYAKLQNSSFVQTMVI